jgi:hypothetical protein
MDSVMQITDGRARRATKNVLTLPFQAKKTPGLWQGRGSSFAVGRLQRPTEVVHVVAARCRTPLGVVFQQLDIDYDTIGYALKKFVPRR